jgi:hypothetical protein
MSNGQWAMASPYISMHYSNFGKKTFLPMQGKKMVRRFTFDNLNIPHITLIKIHELIIIIKL